MSFIVLEKSPHTLQTNTTDTRWTNKNLQQLRFLARTFATRARWPTPRLHPDYAPQNIIQTIQQIIHTIPNNFEYNSHNWCQENSSARKLSTNIISWFLWFSIVFSDFFMAFQRNSSGIPAKSTELSESSCSTFICIEGTQNSTRIL